MRTRFHQELDELKEKLLRMGGMAEQAADRAVEAYSRRDQALCRVVLDGERNINVLEREIDELAIDLLAMQQPMAVDLRFIIAVVKINADLERVGDQAVNIVERVMNLAEQPEVQLPVDIPRMAGIATGMVRTALESFIYSRADLAESVLRSDNSLDQMKDEAYTALVEIVKTNSAAAAQAVDVLLMARNLERIGDHATNIAEDVIFWLRGADVRHLGSREAARR